MSVQDIEAVVDKFRSIFNRTTAFKPGEVEASLATVLADDFQCFDSIPYRIDSRQQFVHFANTLLGNLASMHFRHFQPLYRAIGRNAGTFHAYDEFTGVDKDGKSFAFHGRTTFICANEGGQWKIVGAHFSALPKANDLGSNI